MVEYIEYKGKKHPVKLGYYALKRAKMEMTSAKNQDDFALNEFLLFYGLKQGANLEDVDFTFKFEDMEQILDVCLKEFMEMLPKFFPDVDFKNLQSTEGIMVGEVKKKK